ncbi:hypothetical protein J6590_014768 [Homalodisca vitripennis]|nr:hypothetical protein J6590_014768 [Homalodisca vitripennis]
MSAAEKFPCHRCGREYRYKTSLQKHLRQECGVAPKFACPVCPYRAKQKSSLQSHMVFKH